MNKALFLDRDGVINKEKNYLYEIKDFEFIVGVFETCRYFQDLGYLIIIVTNQAGIARKKYNDKNFNTLNNWMIREFHKKKIIISKVYYCPHHPDFTGSCKCRKPEPGLILQARDEFIIDLNSSILVGDKESDIEAGLAAGIGKNYLINTGHNIIENKNNIPVLNTLNDLKYKEYSV